MEIKEQALRLHAAPYLCLQRHDFKRLTNGVRKFIDQLREKDSPRDSYRTRAEFVFVPLELGFEFACLNGGIDEDGDGHITLRIMLNLETISDSLSSEYVGSVMNVSCTSLLRFIETLEAEVAFVCGERNL